MVVNELYYDHPGADAGYEFVELLNTGAASVSLDGFVLEFHNGAGDGWVVVWRAPAGGSIPADGIFVIGGSALDPAPDVVFDFALQNGPDAVRLLDGSAAVLDLVGYGGLDHPAYVEMLGAAAVEAGQSIARTPDGRDTGNNSIDFLAAAPSPGRRNVARHDIALFLSLQTPARWGRPRAGIESVQIEIENRGLAEVPAGAVAITARDSSELGISEGATTFNSGAILPGARERAVIAISLAGDGYHWIRITVRYEPDEREQNDRVALLRRSGSPPLLVSEIMSSPRTGCPQFVELYNAGSTDLDATGFSIRDTRLKPAVIASDSLIIAPHEFVIVTPDGDGLRSCGNVSGRVFDVDGTWPSFNKSGGAFADSVVVMDGFEIPVDAVAYPGLKTEQAGFSLERVDLFVTELSRSAVWSLARERGGSPGRIGASALEAPPRVACDVSPNPFFPGEGELLRIAVGSTDGVASVTVRIYEPSGRRIADIGTASSFPAVLLWDGRRADGEIARSGILVLACEAFSADGTRVGVEKVVVGCASRSP